MPVPKQKPEPEVDSRDATDEEIPRTAKRIIACARGTGWRVRVTYSRGPWVDVRGEWKGRIVDAVMVVAKRDGQLLVATWVDGKFESARNCSSGKAAPVGARELMKLVGG